MNTSLQIFIYINVFLIGALTTLAIRHALAHYRPEKHDAEKNKPKQQQVQLSQADKSKLLDAARQNFQSVLDRSATQLQRELQHTSEQLNRQLEKLGNDVVVDETKRYQANLDSLREQAAATLTEAQGAIATQRTELTQELENERVTLTAQLEQDIATQKNRMLGQIDTRLGDAVVSYLTDSMQHEIDLGAQLPYILEQLERHKEEIKHEVSG